MAARLGRLVGPVALIVAVSGKCAWAAGDAPPVVRVVLHTPGSASAATVGEARARVARIYGEFGVEVEWMTVGEARLMPARPGTFAIHLLIRPTAAGLSSSPRAWARALDGPREHDGTILVFFDRLVIGAHKYELPPGLLLGYALAHEIGHVLLPYPAHSPAGMMRADWDGDDLRHIASGALKFTLIQEAMIRAKLASCCGASASGATLSRD